MAICPETGRTIWAQGGSHSGEHVLEGKYNRSTIYDHQQLG